MPGLFYILYRSETEMRPRSAHADELMRQARKTNAQFGLTGFLHHEEGFFFQWLEGNEPALAEICARIEADPRHAGLCYLARGQQPARQFADWDMGYSADAQGSIMAWLVAHPVAQRETLAYASNVLSFLQERASQTVC